MTSYDNVVKKEFGDNYSVKQLEDRGPIVIYLCSAKEPDVIPDKLCVAINKTTNRFGASIKTIDEAIKNIN